jgi:hypothetical protein
MRISRRRTLKATTRTDALCDATVMKTSRISKRLGYGGQIVVNACAYRGVQPKMLLTIADPV